MNEINLADRKWAEKANEEILELIEEIKGIKANDKLKGTLCDTCSRPIDYLNNEIQCYYRFVRIKKGYKVCRGYKKGCHLITKDRNMPIRVKSFSNPVIVFEE